MPCYHRRAAWRHRVTGEIKLNPPNDAFLFEPLLLPCAQCIGCRLIRTLTWSVRILQESMLYKQNSVVTLTYDDEHLPERGQLLIADEQKFMKRLRKKFPDVRIRYRGCGEYGEGNSRPHFHIILLNFDFPDKVEWAKSKGGTWRYKSKILEALWPKGLCEVGVVDHQSARYVSNYCVAKVTGKGAKEHYRREDADGEYWLNPEFGFGSTHPGIGADFLWKYLPQFLNWDFVVVDGRKVVVPTYYDRLIKRLHPELIERRKLERAARALEFAADNTPARLVVREEVETARYALKKRVL